MPFSADLISRAHARHSLSTGVFATSAYFTNWKRKLLRFETADRLETLHKLDLGALMQSELNRAVLHSAFYIQTNDRLFALGAVASTVGNLFSASHATSHVAHCKRFEQRRGC